MLKSFKYKKDYLKGYLKLLYYNRIFMKYTYNTE